jgi:hypothetical protein
LQLSAYVESEVENSVALDDHMRIVEHVLAFDTAEEAFAAPEDDRDYIHRDFVHESGLEDLAADVAGVYGDDPFPREPLSGRNCLCHVVDEVVGRIWVPSGRFGSVRHDDYVVAGGWVSCPTVVCARRQC